MSYDSNAWSNGETMEMWKFGSQDDKISGQLNFKKSLNQNNSKQSLSPWQWNSWKLVLVFLKVVPTEHDKGVIELVQEAETVCR